MKRIFDVVSSILLLVVFCIPMVIIALAIKCSSKGSVLHWSDRIGKDNRIFRMPKFRSMRTDAPQIATHLMRDPGAFLTPIGAFLRRTSLDELPQLLSVLHGDMSLVGPRPALFNQDDLVALRTERGVHLLAPGLTGWAQVNGRDELSIPAKVGLDCEYLEKRSLGFDFKVLFLTVKAVVSRKGVSH